MTMLEWIGAALAAILAAAAWAWRARGKAEQVDRLKADMKAHERMNDADLGHGASDAERVKRLREFADRHGG
jgi:hypothetical protein